MTPTSASILIVDDEINNRKLLEVLLQHQGYHTSSAADGDEALASIERNAPDLILLDAMMPVLDGYQVARILKAHPLSLTIPIIMISAHGDRTSRLAGLQAGAEEFLTKPIDRDELWLRVRNLLRLKCDADLVRTNGANLEQQVQARTVDLQQFRTAMDATTDVVTLVARRTMKYVEVNAAACDLLGYTRDELLSMGPMELISDVEEDLERTYDQIIAGGAGQPVESRFRRKDGTEVWIEVNRHAMQTNDSWTIVSVSRDITDRKEAEERLEHLAHYDPLTGLPNRRLFRESLAKAMEQGDALDLQVVLMYLDLDNFKDVNDSLGHTCGDLLLREVGERLLASLHGRDTVGRLGGDEFGIILLTPRDPGLGMMVANKVREALRVPFQLGGHRVTTSASIGISIYPSDTDDADVLAQYADMAMHEAKHSGRNTARFYTALMNQRAKEKLNLVQALSEALAEEQFVLYYQPKVSLHTGRWTGVEALLRWQRPGHGLVPPNTFIPALEESGLIVAVGAWVIATACRQLATWKLHGMNRLPIAVNVSALQFRNKRGTPATASGHATAEASETIDLLSTVAAGIREYEVTRGLLQIEITESAVMADAEHSVDILKRLRAIGVEMSVDDFGTGYSSLAYLRRFPLEAVKIDGSFVNDVIASEEDVSIVAAIIGIAHRLNLKAIAECVETEDQMRLLQAHDCDQAQGYYFSKPLPVHELEALWNRTNGMFPQVVRNYISDACLSVADYQCAEGVL